MIVDISERGGIAILPTLRKRMLEKWKAGRDEEIVVLVGAVETSLNKFYQNYVMQQLDQIKIGGQWEHVTSLSDLARKLAASNALGGGPNMRSSERSSRFLERVGA